MKTGEQCMNCKADLELMAAVGMFEGVDSHCPNCGVMYSKGEPIAVRKGNIITPINLDDQT